MNRRYVGFRNIPRSTSAPQVIARPGSALNLRNDVERQHEDSRAVSRNPQQLRASSEIMARESWLSGHEIRAPTVGLIYAVSRQIVRDVLTEAGQTTYPAAPSAASHVDRVSL